MVIRHISLSSIIKKLDFFHMEVYVKYIGS